MASDEKRLPRQLFARTSAFQPTVLPFTKLADEGSPEKPLPRLRIRELVNLLRDTLDRMNLTSDDYQDLERYLDELEEITRA